MFSRKLMLTAMVGLAFACSAALAADPAKPMTAQQMKMSQCNKDATGRTGDARKLFMKTCLSAKSDAAAPQTQQMKMTTCNADASTKALKGDERKAYMKTCLSAGSTAVMH